jgi:hypothetical protein
MGMHFLTVLDTAACLPLSDHSATVTATLDAFTLLLKRSESRMEVPWRVASTEDQFKTRTFRCRALAFAQRIALYIARVKGKSMVEYEADVAQMRAELGVPPDSSIFQEIHAIGKHYAQRNNEIIEAFKEATQLEWTGPLIPVDNVSTPVESPKGVQCITRR